MSDFNLHDSGDGSINLSYQEAGDISLADSSDTVNFDLNDEGIAGPPGTAGPAGEDGEDGVGVPSGGTTGQVLTKSSSADYATAWSTPTSAVTSVNGSTGAVSLTQDDISDGTTYKQYSQTEKTKLSGIEAGATADQTAVEILTAVKTVDGSGSGLDADTVDGNEAAALLSRSNHTGTQAASTISDLTETVQDIVGTQIVAGTNVTATYNDTDGTVTISASGGGGAGVDSVNGESGVVTVEGTNLGTGAPIFNQTTTNAGAIALEFKNLTSSDGSLSLTDVGTDVDISVNGAVSVFNAKEYGATGDGSTDDSAAIRSAIDAASTAGGGTVYLPAGNYRVTSASRTDTVSYSSGNTFNDTSADSGDVDKYVLWANLGRVAKITSVIAGVSFTVDVLPLTTSATTAEIITPGIVIPEGVALNGAGSNSNHQLTAGGATSQVCTQITDVGTGVSILIRGANSPAGGSTRYGISSMSVIGNSSNMYGLFVGNGAWLINSDNLELSNHGIAGLGLDGNINSHNFHNTIFYGSGSAAASTPTGGVVTHPYNAAGSASCNFYNPFFSSNYGFGICDGDPGGSYGVNLWAPQFNSQQASAMTDSGTSMVLQSKGAGDGMATVVGGWSETAANYDVITSGYVTIIGMRMHSSHDYHWLVNGGIANAVGCTFEGATNYTVDLINGGVFTWTGILSADPGLYSDAPAPVPSVGSSSVMFANSLQGNGGSIIGDLLLSDAATANRAYRFRTSGASVDLDFAGSTLYLSGYPNADFTGTQQFYLGLDTGGNADAFGVWRFHTAPFAATKVTIDSGSSTPVEINGGLRLDGSTSGSTVVQASATASGTLTLPAATDTLVGKATTDTLTNKTIALGSNTISGTLAQLNTVITDADVASLAGTETLTNKTLTSPVINNPSGFLTGAAKITVGTVAPSSPSTGDLWVDTN